MLCLVIIYGEFQSLITSKIITSFTLSQFLLAGKHTKAHHYVMNDVMGNFICL